MVRRRQGDVARLGASAALAAFALAASACTTAPASLPDDPVLTDAPAVNAPADLSGQTLGVRLYDQLRAGDDNVVISPVSLMGAFGVVSAGARGQTRTALLSSLSLPDSPSLDADLGALLRSLEREDGQTTLSVANAVWVQDGFGLKPDFVESVQRDYGALARPVDFRDAPDEAAGRINAWVSGQTRRRIPELLSPSSINDATRLIVTNAVYFLGDWAQPFNASNTSDQTFYRADGSRLSTPMMYQRGYLRLLETGALQAIDLPYRGDRLSMTVILPRTRGGLSDVEAQLSANLAGWLIALDEEEPRRVLLYLPKTETALSYDLIPQLTMLGMGIAFADGADFRSIADAPLAIGQVVHKTFLRIDEKGTEAAAATGIAVEQTSAPVTPPPTFRADHPFLFLIRDKETGAILFLGRINRPEAPAA